MPGLSAPIENILLAIAYKIALKWAPLRFVQMNLLAITTVLLIKTNAKQLSETTFQHQQR